MQATSSSNKGYLIPATIVVLFLFNIVYWIGKFRMASWPAAAAMYHSITEHWGLLMFLEFLAISAIFVDLVVQWDKLVGRPLQIRLTVTALLFSAFVAQFLIGMIDLFMAGEMQ
jgi:hypothetical protein